MDAFAGHVAEPLSLNKYLYVKADPINSVDPSGLVSLPELSVAEDIEGEMQTVSVNTGKAILKKVGCEMVEWAANEALNQGIYVLTDGLGSFYVGQSNDFKRRLIEHAKDDAKAGFKIFARVAVPILGEQAGKDILRIAEQLVMDIVEKQGKLINKINAVSNSGRLRAPLEAIKNLSGCK